MRRRIYIVLAALAACGVATLVWVLVLAPKAAGANAPAVRDAVLPLVGLGVLGCAGLGVLLWRLLERDLFAPAAALARDLRTLLQAKRVDRGVRVPSSHALGDLPLAVAELTDALRASRREVVKAMATAAAQTEQEKGWLEHILLELVPEAVMVCNLEHRILLYNQAAARLFGSREALGLGRSVLELVTEAPLRHALTTLELRLKAGRRDLGLEFVCASKGTQGMLESRISLIVDATRSATGYALSLDDVSGQLESRRVNALLRRSLTRDLRGPLANLRAAAETLQSESGLDDEHRRAFESVVSDESARLSDMVESLSESVEVASDSEWPMTEIHSPDLLACLAAHLASSGEIRLDVRGDPVWLVGDSHLLMVVLAELGSAIAARFETDALVAEAGTGAHRSFVELSWDGEPVPERVLDEWLDAALTMAPETTARVVLDRHGCEPWSREREDGHGAVLHFPLRTAARAPDAEPDAAESANPERYDFGLMYAGSFEGDLGERHLKQLSYVVFDTETTGLRPAAGDEIISIAGVRVTQGRVLEGERFEALVNPQRSIPPDSIRFHGITDDMVRDQPTICEVLSRFHEFAGDAVLVAHNAAFDMKFLKLKESICGLGFDNPVIDTLLLSLLVEGSDEDHTLDGICERLDVRISDRHSALGDALATAHVLVHLLERLESRELHTFHDVMRATDMREQLQVRAHNF